MQNTILFDGINYEQWEKIIQSPDFLLKLAYRWKEDRDARAILEAENTALKTENAKIKRQSEIAANIDSNKLLSTSEIAREYGKPATWLNGILSELLVQYRENGRWVLSDDYKDDGYVKYVPMTFGGRKMPKFTVNHLYWTYKGKQFIYNLLKGDGILPLDEQENKGAENNE